MPNDSSRRAGSDLLGDVSDNQLDALLSGDDPVTPAIIPTDTQPRKAPSSKASPPQQTASLNQPAPSTSGNKPPQEPAPRRPRRGSVGAHETTVFFRPAKLYLDTRIWALKHATKASTVVSALVELFFEDPAIMRRVQTRIEQRKQGTAP